MHAGLGREYHSMSMRALRVLFVPSESARVRNEVERATGGVPRNGEARSNRRPNMKVKMVSLVSGILALVIVSAQGSGIAQSGDELTQRTAHYRITLDIGPRSTMLRPDQAAKATKGEVMVAMPGMPMPTMTLADQGRSVNRHLEVGVYDKATGALLGSPMPTITVTDPATGKARTLQGIVGMYDIKKGERDLHFGNNIHLANGTYLVTVSVGGEQAVFKKVAVGHP
jgi:hypothetical protein